MFWTKGMLIAIVSLLVVVGILYAALTYQQFPNEAPVAPQSIGTSAQSR